MTVATASAEADSRAAASAAEGFPAEAAASAEEEHPEAGKNRHNRCLYSFVIK